jgi:thioredoxin 1
MAKAVTTLTAQAFESAVSASAGTWIVDFWAEWCAPCHALAPVLDEIAAEVNAINVGKVDVTEYPEIGDRFDIRSLPTVVVFRDGVEVRRLFGTKTKRQLLAAAASGS